MPDVPVLYSAPGAGLGHLVRACAVALYLQELDVTARIVSDSPFAAGMARLTGCAIDYIPRGRWLEDVPGYVASLEPQRIVADTFPCGLRGEWAGYTGRMVIVARRLLVDAYREATGLPLDAPPPGLDCVIAAEPLNAAYQHIFDQWGTKTIDLPGRIRLPDTIPAPPVPDALAALLDCGNLWLVVHSGPRDEVRRLVEIARMAMGAETAPLTVISPFLSLDLGNPCRDVPVFEYFPAARLFPKARHIVTGAGYNLMAETAAYAEKHIPVPFPRRFDDQAGRIGHAPLSATNGGLTAARAILSSMAL